MSIQLNYNFLLLILILSVVSCSTEPEYTIVQRDAESLSIIPNSEFVGSQKCMKCHQSSFKDWKGSHHDNAMQLADSASVLAAFEGEEFSSQGVTSRFFKKNRDYYVNTEGPDGNYYDYKIIYTFGVTPLQQYIVAFPDGNYQCLRTAWDSKERKWFDLYPDFKVVHSEWLHWSKGGLKWNTMCADCHSTNVQKNFDSKTDSYQTSFSEINVSCEACHGPGKRHIEAASKNNYNASMDHLFMTSKTTAAELVDACARCHMRREQLANTYTYASNLLDNYFPQLIETPIYFADGQISDEDYVYASFKQSKMFQNNVSCKDCHNPHTLKLKFEGNQLCIQCHDPFTYNSYEHHKHPTDTESSLCINCHMTGKYYMGNDFRRDHSFRIPRPDLSLEYGTPNACTNCHTDQTDQWAAKSFKELWGEVDKYHFSEKLIPGVLAKDGADLLLRELINDSITPEIVRASAVRALQNYNSQEQIQLYINLLKDRSAMVKTTSIDALSSFDQKQLAINFLPLLNDPVKSVRIKAFFGIGILSELEIPQPYKEVYKNVKLEFEEYIKVNLDFAGGRMRHADYLLKQGNINQAIAEYEKAVEIDGLNNIARTNLANLYYRIKDFKKAEAAFKVIEEQEPNFGPTYYSLGLLYAELKEYHKAIEQLEIAITYNPENIRIPYNLSLIYDSLGQNENAIKTLENALKSHSENEELLYVLAYLYSKYHQTEKAKTIAESLVKSHPQNQGYQSFLKSLSN